MFGTTDSSDSCDVREDALPRLEFDGVGDLLRCLTCLPLKQVLSCLESVTRLHGVIRGDFDHHPEHGIEVLSNALIESPLMLGDHVMVLALGDQRHGAASCLWDVAVTIAHATIPQFLVVHVLDRQIATVKGFLASERANSLIPHHECLGLILPKGLCGNPPGVSLWRVAWKALLLDVVFDRHVTSCAYAGSRACDRPAERREQSA